MAMINKRTPKQHTFVSASGGQVITKPGATQTGNSGALRLVAVLLWLLAIGCEVVAVLAFKKVLTFVEPMWLMIGALALDLVLVIIASQCWKKANRISPASRKNGLTFWLWNNLGVIMSIIAFAPFLVLLLTDKNADAKTKKLGAIMAAVALLIAGLASYDFNPVAQEDINAVYWAAGGEVYHIDPNCSYLDRTGELVQGSVEEAAQAGKGRLCSLCESRLEAGEFDQGVELTPITDLTDVEGRTDGTQVGGEDLPELIPDAA